MSKVEKRNGGVRFAVMPLEGMELMDWYALRNNAAKWDSLEAQALDLYVRDLTDAGEVSARRYGALPSERWPSMSVRRKYLNLARAARREARKRPYIIQRHGEYWSTQKLNNEGDCYNWICPAAMHCRSEEAAVEWMMADVECRTPRYDIIFGGSHEREEYFCDAQGRRSS